MLYSREPDFSFSRLEIHVFEQKLETLCSVRADPILAFRALKFVFKANNQTPYARLARTRIFLLTLKIHVFSHKLDTLCSTRKDPILAFRALNLYLTSQIRHFILPLRGPNFSFSHHKIHLLGHYLNTLCSSPAKQTLFAPLTQTRFFLLAH